MNFLEKILRRSCSHRFSWPRVDSEGRHYQICLTCGAAYEYDWSKMRLTRRPLTFAATVADRLATNFSRPSH